MCESNRESGWGQTGRRQLPHRADPCPGARPPQPVLGATWSASWKQQQWRQVSLIPQQCPPRSRLASGLRDCSHPEPEFSENRRPGSEQRPDRHSHCPGDRQSSLLISEMPFKEARASTPQTNKQTKTEDNCKNCHLSYSIGDLGHSMRHQL